MDFILGFLFGYVFTYPCFIGLFILGIIFEAYEAHSWAVFSGIVAATSAYFLWQVDVATILEFVLCYFVIGFVWSIWRYKRHAMDIIEQNKEASEFSRLEALRYLHPTKMLSQITTWVLIWPLSMIESVTGDLIKLIQTAISKFFNGIYTKIYASAVKDLTSEDIRV